MDFCIKMFENGLIHQGLLKHFFYALRQKWPLSFAATKPLCLCIVHYPLQQQHVSGLLLLLLLVKSFTINNVADVAGFLDLSINLAFVAIFDHKYVARWLSKTENRVGKIPTFRDSAIEPKNGSKGGTQTVNYSSEEKLKVSRFFGGGVLYCSKE
jgi:hypothetical protein